MAKNISETGPDFCLETEMLGCNAMTSSLIAGADEVGRGPWAGPVVSAAVCLCPTALPPTLLAHLQDSKKLSPNKRTKISADLYYHAQSSDPGVYYEITEISVATLDHLNILQASLLGMAQSVTRLHHRLGARLCGALFDGPHCPPRSHKTPLPFPVQAIIKGDSRSASIAAASILAKTYRDQIMTQWASLYPNYGWQTNAGYGTKFHQTALAKYGVTPLHRRSFKPIQAVIAAQS